MFKIMLTLIIIGIFMIASTSYSVNISLVYKQILFVIVGFLLIKILKSIDFKYIKKNTKGLYIITNILLILVLFTKPINGATSWFQIGGISIQPSEFSKITLILMFAKILEENKDNKLKYFKLLAYAIIPIILICIEPDFGTAIVILGTLAIMIFFSGIKTKYVVPIILIGITSAFGILYFISNGNNLFFNQYQADRIRVFLNPNLDPYDKGYNALKVRQVIGSGKIFGQGYFKGIQNQLGNIPEKTTDFIFSVIGEELGFIFCIILFIIYFLFLIKILIASKKARDYYSKLVLIGIFSVFLIHITINIGMNVGVLPITGIPLPFISYGGSSLLTNMILVGTYLNLFN